MSSGEVKDRAKSIRAKLRNYAQQTRTDYNQVLTRYGLERLLYRLSASEHSNSFLLKGALLFLLWHDLPNRPTRDVDLLGFGPDDVESVVKIFKDICSVECDDGMIFDVTSIQGSVIRKSSGYRGVNVTLNATLDSARVTIRIDIGFGDAITPEPTDETFPVILSDSPAPLIRAYPRFTVCAEKFEAICSLGIVNTRIKDYFDLWLLLADGMLDDEQLGRAIEATFRRRDTALPMQWPIGLSSEYTSDPAHLAQWMAFIRKNQLQAPSLVDVVQVIRHRLANPIALAGGASLTP
jgi:hypothetical protein